MRLKTRENFWVLRILFLAVENLRLLACMTSLRSFNDGQRSIHIREDTCARVESTDSVTRVGGLDGSCHSG